MITATQKKEIAKDIVMRALSMAYYSLENREYEILSEDDKNDVKKYINMYGVAMGKSIRAEYYTV